MIALNGLVLPATWGYGQFIRAREYFYGASNIADTYDGDSVIEAAHNATSGLSTEFADESSVVDAWLKVSEIEALHSGQSKIDETLDEPSPVDETVDDDSVSCFEFIATSPIVAVYSGDSDIVDAYDGDSSIANQNLTSRLDLE